ncbi:MAG: hypothetical protein AAF944_25265, partial [Bacteroidota bacterium]
MEELNNLRKSVNLMKAQMGYLRDHIIKLDETVQQVGDNLDSFIEVYTLEHVWEEIWLRLQKCESDNYFGFCHKTTSILCKLRLQSYPIHNGK